MKRRTGQIMAFVLCLSLLWTMGGLGEVSAKTLEEIRQEQLENKKNQDDAKSKKENAQKVVDGLQDEADDLKDTYQSYNSRLQNVNQEISDTREAIASATAGIQTLEEELEQAKEDQQAQYEGMKMRIQYMYENGSDSLITMLLESGSMVEFLQRAEDIAAITSYDRTMVNAYNELQDTITSKTEQLTAKRESLAEYNETLSAKQDELDDLVNNAQAAYTAKSGEVSAAQMSVAEYEAKLAEFRQKEAALEGEAAAAQAAIGQQMQQQQGAGGETGETPAPPEDTSGALNGYSEADLKLMAAIIQAEAGGESYAGQLAVGTVIMNRIYSSYFPNTLSGVIYQPNQFQPVRDGHLALILERGPNESCTNAARQVLNGYRSGDWLFFMTKKWADYYGITGYVMIGNHAFFQRWGAN